MFAQRLSGMRESFIREMTRLAIQHQTINLSQGFPDFGPPPEVITAAHRALDEGANQYTITWGNPALRQAIAAKMARLYGLDFDPDKHVTVTCGVTEAIAATLMSLCNPGDEVIIIEPFHEGYAPAVTFTGASPRFVALEAPDYALDLERLRAAFNQNTKAIILNTPHNPTGHVFTRAELEGVAALCDAFDVALITDEIYEFIVYDGRAHIPPATIPGLAERTVTIGGLGKTYAATGWRLGYACAPAALSTALRTVHDFTTICAAAPLQAAAVTALNLPDDYYTQLKRDYAERRALMMKILDDIGLAAQPPQGAYYVMADFSGWAFDGDDFDLARWLPQHLGVSVVPGSAFFGTPDMGTNLIRFAFAKKIETLQAAGERLRRRVQDV